MNFPSYHGVRDGRIVVVSDAQERIALQSSHFGVIGSNAVRLSMIETAFLSQSDKTLIVEQKSDRTILCRSCVWQMAAACAPQRFPYVFAAYRYLLERGWTVRSGIKFGADFLLYRGDDGQHAKYTVVVLSERPQHQLGLNDLTV